MQKKKRNVSASLSGALIDFVVIFSLVTSFRVTTLHSQFAQCMTSGWVCVEKCMLNVRKSQK